MRHAWGYVEMRASLTCYENRTNDHFWGSDGRRFQSVERRMLDKGRKGKGHRGSNGVAHDRNRKKNKGNHSKDKGEGL